MILSRSHLFPVLITICVLSKAQLTWIWLHLCNYYSSQSSFPPWSSPSEQFAFTYKLSMMWHDFLAEVAWAVHKHFTWNSLTEIAILYCITVWHGKLLYFSSKCCRAKIRDTVWIMHQRPAGFGSKGAKGKWEFCAEVLAIKIPSLGLFLPSFGRHTSD